MTGCVEKRLSRVLYPQRVYSWAKCNGFTSKELFCMNAKDLSRSLGVISKHDRKSIRSKDN